VDHTESCAAAAAHAAAAAVALRCCAEAVIKELEAGAYTRPLLSST